MYQITPTMNDPRSTPIRKSKLVTISSTANDSDAFANLFPTFTFSGNSVKQKTEVQVSFPSYCGNLMFYEHFRDSNSGTPFLLSFMYLGRNAKGQINYSFRDYKTVEIAEFCKELQSVNLVFQVVNQLPKCREVRIHLDDKNISLSSEELSPYDRSNDFPCTSSTVKTLTIKREGGSNDQNFARKTRFTDIMEYAIKFFPNLEYLYVEAMDGGGTSYDLIETFCRVQCMPKHNVSIQKGRIFCEPEVYQPKPSRKSRNAIVITQEDRNFPVNVMPPSSGCCSTGTSRNQPTVEPMKQESAIPSRVPEPDVIVVPPPPAPLVDTIVISDDEENEASSPKKPKIESVEEIGESPRFDAVSPASTASISSPMATGVVSNPPIPANSSSLTSIISSYNNDWDSSSDDERETLQNPANPERKSTNPPAPTFIKNELGQVSENVGNQVVINANVAAEIPMKAEELINILNAAKGVIPVPREVTEKGKPNAKPKKKENFREGVHFDRRPGSSSHKRRTD